MGEHIIHILSFIGISAFSASGAMVGIKKGADIFGIMLLASVTATGGGVLRDVLLGTFPPYIFLNPNYIIIAVLISVSLFLLAYIFPLKYQEKSDYIEKANNIFDAIGLGIFVALGTQTAMEQGFSKNMFLSVAIGTITGVGGGFLRDIMVLRVPMILRKDIYASAAILGGTVFYLLQILSVNYGASLLISSVTTFALRMFATYFKWNLPKIYFI